MTADWELQAVMARGKRLAAEADRKPITTPEMFIGMATFTTQYAPDHWIQDTYTDMVDLLTPHLKSAETADWWHSLRQCLVKQQQTADMGPDWDEVGIDWDARVVEAAELLAGVS